VPQLRRVDLVLSVAVAHLVVDGIACFVVLGGMVLLRDHAMVDDWWTVAGAFLGGIALGTGLALLGAALNSINRGVQKFWVSAQRLLYMISGVFYLPMHMPEGVRDWMTLNPVLHLIEWFRHGVFPQYEPPWLSPLYVLQWAACLAVLGLALEVALRRHVRP
jgi:capsular polysaccharide transport system permease protein